MVIPILATFIGGPEDGGTIEVLYVPKKGEILRLASTSVVHVYKWSPRRKSWVYVHARKRVSSE